MRISTSQIFRQGISAILDHQHNLSQTQQQISTGKRINKPSDDPTGVARLLEIKEQIATVGQYERNANFAKTQLSLEENALVGIANILERVRELTIQASNDTLNTNNRQSIAAEIRTRLDELVAIGNSKDGSGDYLFAGFQDNDQPFLVSGNIISYSGDQGQIFSQVGARVQVATGDSGARVFQLIDRGNGSYIATDNPANTGTAVVGATALDGSFVTDTYTIDFTQLTPADPVTYQVSGVTSGVVAAGNYNSGNTISFNGVALTIDGEPEDTDSFTVSPSGRQDIFTTLDKLATALESGDDSAVGRAQFHNEVNRQLNNLDRAQDNVLGVRAQVGTRLNNIESQSQLNGDFILQMQEAQSAIEDVDFVEAISQLNLRTVALQAAQQAYVRVQDLSLFNLL
jgi:flagellar hook-associated protein 3 FlgL